jgi:hypothetical protein
MATSVVAACTASPLLAGTAQAAAGGSAATARTAVHAASGPLRLTVTSVSPSYARFGGTVTITGRVRNVSGSALSGLTVQLWSSTRRLASRIDLVGYAHGTYLPPDPRLVPVAEPAKRRLVAGHSWN